MCVYLLPQGLYVAQSCRVHAMLVLVESCLTACCRGRQLPFFRLVSTALLSLILLLLLLLLQQRMVSGVMWLNARGPYKTLRDLWDEDEGGAE